MARGVYTVAFDQQAFTNANGDYDFFELVPATDKPIEIVALEITNKSEIGDAQEEMVAWSIVRGNTSTGNGGATTPQPTSPGDGAASFTAETVGSTPASAGTPVTLHAGTFNIRTGLDKYWPEGTRHSCSAGQSRICVRLLTALADDATLSGTITVRELV